MVQDGKAVLTPDGMYELGRNDERALDIFAMILLERGHAASVDQMHMELTASGKWICQDPPISESEEWTAIYREVSRRMGWAP